MSRKTTSSDSYLRDRLNYIASEKLNLYTTDRVELARWYTVTSNQLHKAGVGGILVTNGSSIHNLLSRAFPNHKFEAWKFRRVSPSFWSRVIETKDRETARRFLEEKSEIFGIKDPLHWARVSAAQLEKENMRDVVKKFGGLEKLHEFAYSTS